MQKSGLSLGCPGCSAAPVQRDWFHEKITKILRFCVWIQRNWFHVILPKEAAYVRLTSTKELTFSRKNNVIFVVQRDTLCRLRSLQRVATGSSFSRNISTASKQTLVRGPFSRKIMQKHWTIKYCWHFWQIWWYPISALWNWLWNFVNHTFLTFILQTVFNFDHCFNILAVKMTEAQLEIRSLSVNGNFGGDSPVVQRTWFAWRAKHSKVAAIFANFAGENHVFCL